MYDIQIDELARQLEMTPEDYRRSNPYACLRHNGKRWEEISRDWTLDRAENTISFYRVLIVGFYLVVYENPICE